MFVYDIRFDQNEILRGNCVFIELYLIFLSHILNNKLLSYHNETPKLKLTIHTLESAIGNDTSRLHRKSNWLQRERSLDC